MILSKEGCDKVKEVHVLGLFSLLQGRQKKQALCSLDFPATSSVGQISSLCISKLQVSRDNTEQTNAAPSPNPPVEPCDREHPHSNLQSLPLF